MKTTAAAQRAAAVELVMQKKSLLFLRLGLAATFLYSGIDMIRHPLVWQGFIPQWLIDFLPVSPSAYLAGQGTVELLFALSFATGFLVRYTSLLVSFELLAIIAFSGINAVTFRDLGLLGASAALTAHYWTASSGLTKQEKGL